MKRQYREPNQRRWCGTTINVPIKG